jgi:hypothetical protein
MIRKSVSLLILLAVWRTAQAMPHHCSVLAAEGRNLWVVVDGDIPRHVLSTERPIAAGAWSPDGHHIAFSMFPPSSDSAVEVAVAAEASGRILGRFRVDRPQSEAGLRFINGLEWRGPRTLVTLGNAGPHGGYMDVWRFATDYSSAERVRRALILGGLCAISPSMQYAACIDESTIMIFDTLKPAGENGVVDDERYFVTPDSDRPDARSERLEGNLAWNSKGAVLYAVRSLHEKRVLTAIEKTSAAAEGWSITDREIVGIESQVVGVELDANGGLLLSDGHQAFRVDEATGATGSAVVARVISAAELRRPGALPGALEVATDHGKLRLNVLDTHCQSPASQR